MVRREWAGRRFLVVDIREMLRSSQNRYLDAVASDTTDLTVIRNELTELGFQIESSEIPAIHSSRSWVHFAFEAGA